MLGKYHLLFNLMTFLPIYVFLYKNSYDYNIIIASTLMLFLFSNFPDIDIYKSKHGKSKILSAIFYFFFIILALVLRKKEKIKHRGITHSIYGLGFFSIVVILIWILILNLEINWLKSSLIPISIIGAYFLHLIEDAITIEGVDLLMNKKKLRGIIRVKKTDGLFTIIYSFFQILNLIYFINNLNHAIVTSIIISIIFLLFPILIYYTRRDSK